MIKFITIAFLVFGTSLFAQQNLVYAELGGAGPIISVNYERQLFQESHLNFRAGLGFYTGWYAGLSAPLGVYYLQDFKKGNYLELGMTYTLLLTGWEDNEPGGFILPAIGYRKYSLKRKSFFKITFNPIFFDNNDSLNFLPWGGISFGIRL
ncbi:hypothetical protein [Flagellimonas pelagia]|uniref:Outer membrane protein beta-barrel domain-containing protein n=1 Tax=Flagellimonas pelagia TaxID=2306998 RepID=A0A3A1NHK6_9FLAO|nr:hypothetical protein [Allomuricauda maritima]RIV42936.1 hypothetical protein D2V05_15080 [Allomuricauda maritima]TXJ92133.1 hypothetical protein FQ017_14945 [Allomuricauda maritima]